MKRHLKRINAPKTWKIARKTETYIKRPNAGAHSYNLGISLVTLLREVDSLAQTAKEIRNILTNQEVFVNDKRVKDANYLVGFMDIVSIPKIHYFKRLTLHEKGYLILEKIDEKDSHFRMIKLIGKKQIGKKIQYNFLDGTNMLAEKAAHAIGDTLVIGVKDKKVIKTIPFKEGATIILHKGKNIGTKGKIIKIDKSNITVDNGAHFETKKAYAFVIA